MDVIEPIINIVINIVNTFKIKQPQVIKTLGLL